LQFTAKSNPGTKVQVEASDLLFNCQMNVKVLSTIIEKKN